MRTRTGDVAHRVHEVRVRDRESTSAVAAEAATWSACIARKLHDIGRGHLARLLRRRLQHGGLRRLLRAPAYHHMMPQT